MPTSKTMPLRFDHVDLRVRSLAEARPFYERLLPALGFMQDMTMRDGCNTKHPVWMVRRNFLASPSCRHTWPTNAALRSGLTVPEKWIGSLRWFFEPVLGRSKTPRTRFLN
jgi:hypothetical protein